MDNFNDLDLTFINEVLDCVPANIYFKDTECRYVFCTHYWRHINYKEKNFDIKGKTDLDIRVDVENAKKAMEQDREILRTGKGVSYIIKEDYDGITEYLEIIKEPYIKNGKILGIVGQINDITDRVTAELKLSEAAKTDQLTSVYNRQFLEEWANEINIPDLYPLTVVSADINYLKKVNDLYGHAAGDKYIKSVTNIFKSTLPDSASIVRMGGDEFLILLPNRNEEETEEIIKEITNKAETKKVEDITLSVSFGYKTIQKYKKNIEKDIDKADEEMYKCKKQMHKKIKKSIN